jgi:hypothetical protein
MSHDEIVEFIKPWLKKKNVYTRTYNYTLMSGLFIISSYFSYTFFAGEFQMKAVSDLFLGSALGFLVIPLHEWLHGIAYKMMGAPKVDYRANWKKLVFYAAADGYTAGYKEFRFVALLPFSVISILGLTVMVWSGFEWAVLMFGLILSHVACCGGDFGLLSYMYEHKDRGIVTLDDMAKKETLFMVIQDEIA